MEKRIERSQTDKALRRLRRLLAPLGFERTKPRFFTRSREFVIEFVHVHKLTFEPGFRVHLGLRVTNDAFEACSLNGPATDSSYPATLEFDASEQSVGQCAAQILHYVEGVGEAWFLKWRDLDRLVSDPASPLDATAKACLQDAMSAGGDPDHTARTRALLGAPQPGGAANAASRRC
jgi:hypothetical protein